MIHLSPPSASRRAWTLLEALIVLAIVVVLSVLTVPLFRAINAAGHTAKCLLNLRAIYTATIAFAEDYNTRLPPSLGPATAKHPAFDRNSYWWHNAYLGRYVLNQPNRSRDSAGRLSQSEAEPFNCPARFVEGPDAGWVVVKNSPAVSYLMAYRQPEDDLFRTIKDRSKKIYITEGRYSTMYRANCKTGAPGTKATDRRLRRYHNGSIHLLFYDGHTESFNGPDEEIVLKVPKTL